MNKPSFSSRASKIPSVKLSEEEKKVAEYCIIDSLILYNEYLSNKNKREGNCNDYK